MFEKLNGTGPPLEQLWVTTAPAAVTVRHCPAPLVKPVIAKLVVVACVVVALFAVTFWRLVVPNTERPPRAKMPLMPTLSPPPT